MERVVTPTVALTIVLRPAASAMNFKISLGRESASAPPAKRLTSQAPTRPSSVFPAAIPADVASEPAVVAFARKAPSAIAGQTRFPKRRKDASAIPAGGHTAVALGWTTARLSPSFAAAR